MGNYNYHCFNTTDRNKCEFCSSNGQVIIEEKGEYKCPNDDSNLKCIGELNGSAAIKTPTRNRFLDEQRKKRNKEHFVKEVLPSIGDPDAKKHHVKKLGYKN